MSTYSTDWSNIDLSRPINQDLNILDPLDFSTLLLEISCNLPVITRETIKMQFETDLKCKIESAKQVFNDNLDNILKEALKYRNSK